MRSICLNWKRAACPAISCLLLLFMAVSALSQEVACRIGPPGYDLDGEPIAITVTLRCGDGGTPLPVGTPLVIGLTIYSDPFSEDAFQPDGVLPEQPGELQWFVLGDEYAESYDFPLQSLEVGEDTGDLPIMFTAPAEALADRRYLLTAVWTVSSKEACDATDEFQRQGCRDYGYVVGFNLDGLMIAYPGLVYGSEAEDAQSFVPRWIVERFR